MSNDLAYQIITDRMVKALESGTVPWRKPWNASTSGPRNIEGRRYNGVNVFMTLMQGYDSPYWLTRTQVNKRGGTIRKGESYTPVVFWKINRIKDKVTGDVKTVPLLIWYKVWNLEQVDGINPPAEPEKIDFDPIEAAEKIIANATTPVLRHDADSAYYVPATDEIHLPEREAFHAEAEYYSTAFHEMIHSTGHKDRLDRHSRPGMTFGSHAYGREELVAEMGAAFLAGEAGILPETFDNSASYIASWIKLFQGDPRAIVVAAGAAQKAADHVLGRGLDQGDDEE
jgi:antirestriction protein ArdC